MIRISYYYHLMRIICFHYFCNIIFSFWSFCILCNIRIYNVLCDKKLTHNAYWKSSRFSIFFRNNPARNLQSRYIWLYEYMSVNGNPSDTIDSKLEDIQVPMPMLLPSRWLVSKVANCILYENNNIVDNFRPNCM